MKRTFKFILAFAVMASFAFTTPNDGEPKKTITVVIDAGHGGNDDGMTVGELTEKEIVSSISNKILEANANSNVVIHLTRKGDQYISLLDRANLINELSPDLVLSLHVNGNNNTAVSGVEFYVSPKNVMYTKSKEIAQDINERFVNNHNLKSRGVKDANFMILRETQFPSITVEFGFLSNEDDRKYLVDNVQQEKFATTILDVISTLK